MPKIESKRVRVKDPETGIWHDIPAIVSKESFLAAERAAGSEADAAQHALSAEESAQQAAASAAYNAQLPVVEAMEAARQSAAYADEAAENAASAISTAQGAVETAEDAAETAEDAAQKAQTAVQTATAAAVAAVPQSVTDWLEDNVNPTGSAVVVDSSLSISSAAADAKVTGDKITDLKSAISYVKNNLYNVENLLLTKAKKIVYNKSYYSAAEHDSQYLSYAVINMQATTTYVIVPETRFITFDTGVEVDYPSANYEFTPTSTRDVYITFYNDINTYGGWCVYQKDAVSDQTKIGTFQKPYPGDWLLGTFDKAKVIAKMIDGFGWGNLKNEMTLLYSDKYIYAGSAGVIPYTTGSQNYNTYELAIEDSEYTFSKQVRFLTAVDAAGKSIAASSTYAMGYDNTGGNALKLYLSIDKAYDTSIIVSKGGVIRSENVYPKWLSELNGTRKYNGVLLRTRATMNAGDVLELAELNNKKNAEIMFNADVNGAPNFAVGHGVDGTIGSLFEITSTKWYLYEITNGTKTTLRSEAHNLTVDGFVSVQIFVRENAHADIVFSTSSGSITISNVSWYGTSKKPYSKVYSGSVPLTNVTFKYRMGDYDKKIYVYGDSYISLNTNERWPYYVTELGFNSWLLDGYSGRNSANAIISFKTEMEIGKPEYVLWALGMNDPDTASTINSDWKACVEEVIAYCDANGIEIVLATIPCTPTQHNEFKNAYVKESGKRYIDFAKAVNGEVFGDSWYAGMLASDNVHPLAPGAVALAHRAMLDMPELCAK